VLVKNRVMCAWVCAHVPFRVRHCSLRIMPFFGTPTTSSMNRAISTIPLFRDATEFTENILNISKPDAGVYSMRKLDLTNSVTARRLVVAKPFVSSFESARIRNLRLFRSSTGKTLLLAGKGAV
jgi:hypothetical protein